MATRFLERIADGDTVVALLADESGDSVAPALIDKDTERVVYTDKTNDRVLTVETGIRRSYTPTVAVTLTVAQSGMDILLDAAAGFAITLPAVGAGLNYRFTVADAFATTDFTVITPGGVNIIQGGATVAGADVPAADEDTITFVATAELKGDFIDLWSDGTSWFANGRGTTGGSITFTAS